MKNKTLRQVAILGMLIALEVILSRFLSISTSIVKIGFSFIPVAVAAMLYGPIWAGLAAGLADLIGALLFPIGAYFPGFTLTAALTGAAYGIMLYKKDVTWLRTIIAVAFISLVLNLCLDTLWINILYGKSYVALLPTRIFKCVIMAPVQVVVVKYIHAALKKTPLMREEQ